MGEEYRIPFHSKDRNALKKILSSAPHFAGHDQEYTLYNYRANISASSATMPDATAAVREHGFYFCKKGGDREVEKDVLAHIRSAIEATGQVFVIEDLE